MVEIAEYEGLGDLDAPFELTKQHEQAQTHAQHVHESMHCEVPALSWEEYEAGDPCPGCGLPYRDDVPWESKGTMHFTDEERARYEAEEARFKQAHRDCHSVRHSVSGSLTMHCGKCCPPPPLSPEVREAVGTLLRTPKPPHQLMKWRLRLYCGHVVERTTHYAYKSPAEAFRGSLRCPECGLEPATIVDGAAIGLVQVPSHALRTGASTGRTGKSHKPTRVELETKVREVEGEVERLQKR